MQSQQCLFVPPKRWSRLGYRATNRSRSRSHSLSRYRIWSWSLRHRGSWMLYTHHDQMHLNTFWFAVKVKTWNVFRATWWGYLESLVLSPRQVVARELASLHLHLHFIFFPISTHSEKKNPNTHSQMTNNLCSFIENVWLSLPASAICPKKLVAIRLTCIEYCLRRKVAFFLSYCLLRGLW